MELPSRCCMIVTLAMAASWAWADERTPPAPRAPEWAETRKTEAGVIIHTLRTEFQEKPTEVQVLLPSRLEANKRYPVVYVLPVCPGPSDRYGHGLEEVLKHKLHDKHQAIFVYPTFSALPWYADHPTNPLIRQETYFVKQVVPAIERDYPARTGAAGRYLLGFSKSGYGAFSLLLRHPQSFGKAVAWDAPLMMEQPNRFGMEPIYGTAKNFEKYQVSKLLEAKAGELGRERRLFLTGHAGFRDHHERAHQLMTRLKVPHEYREGPARKHDWHSGWVVEAVGLLFGS